MLDLDTEEVAPAEVLEESLSMVKGMADERKILLSVGADASEPQPIFADRTRFKQILLNLLGNAIKYNRNGGEVSVHFREYSADMMRISVKDGGPGIPAGRHDELFKPFSRLGAEKTAGEGTGIGLSVTKQLVELMGGEIGFESEEGAGSTFWAALSLAAGNSAGLGLRPVAE